MTDMKITTRYIGIALGLSLTLLACASGRATEPPRKAPSTAPLAAEKEHLKANLRQFGAEVSDFTASAANPKSVEDPNSFRGRLRAGERRLTARADVLRAQIHTVFGTSPRPTTGAGAGPPPAAQQQMLDELADSEEKLEQVRKTVPR
jgi:hypothetical protein